MKKPTTTTILAFFVTITIFAQTPQVFKYQAVARDNTGAILENQAISLRIGIRQGSETGTIIYRETHPVTTNQFGLVNIEIGTGTVDIGNFSSIDWGNSSKFIETELDPNNGTNYSSMGTAQMLSVPFALYSENTKYTDDDDADPANELQTLNIDGNELKISDGNTVLLPTVSGDNLGNHIAIQNVELNGNWLSNDGDNEGLYVTPDGNVGIGTPTPDADLEVNGHIWQTGTGESIFIGEGAGDNDDLTSNRNVFVGYNAGRDNSSGANNTATGFLSFYQNTIGGSNTAYGYHSLSSNESGSSNIAVGLGSLKSNISGNSNTAIGVAALYSNTNRNNLVAIGDSALYNNEFTGGYDYLATANTAIGSKAMYANTSGYENTSTGYNSLYSNTDGFQNTSNGAYSLYDNKTGVRNTATGFQSLWKNAAGTNNTASGFSSLLSNQSGNNNTAYGSNSLLSNTTGYSNVAIGSHALYSNTDKSNIVAIGDSALYNNGVGAVPGPFEAMGNTAIGSKALYSNTTGDNNTAIGYNALINNDIGNHNTACGAYSLDANTTGEQNTAYGSYSLTDNTEGEYNAAFGNSSLKNNITGEGNTAIGEQCMVYNIGGFNNTAIGLVSGPGLGYPDLDNTSAFGAWTFTTASDQIRIGNSSVSSIGGYAAWSNLSDGRFKKNLNENVAGLDFILKLRPVTYQLDMEAIAQFNNMPDSARIEASEAQKAAEVQSGFVAQEVEAAANSIGYDFHGVDKPKNSNTPYGLRYAEFVVPLVKAVQELAKKADRQQQIIETLEARINQLESK